MSMWDDEAGYDRSDPKHPSFRDNWTYRTDLARKAAKENPPTREECLNDSCGCTDYCDRDRSELAERAAERAEDAERERWEGAAA